jgi:hypothetical protein
MIGFMATSVTLSLRQFRGIGWPGESASRLLAAMHNMPQNAIPVDIS